MMIYFISILLLLFLVVSVVPFVQLLIANICASDKTEYKFPDELFNSKLDELKYEDINDLNINRLAMQNRGSVRLAKGNILSKTSLEERKAKAHSIKLP